MVNLDHPSRYSDAMDWDIFRPNLSAVAADITSNEKALKNALLANGTGDLSPFVTQTIRTYGPALAVAVGYTGKDAGRLYDLEFAFLSGVLVDSYASTLPDNTFVEHGAVLPLSVHPSGDDPIVVRITFRQGNALAAGAYVDLTIDPTPLVVVD